MRKMFLILAVLLPIFALKVNAEDKNVDISLLKLGDGVLERTGCFYPIKSCYYGMLEGILTTVSEDLGEIMITVENCTTGEMWESSFDSSLNSQYLLSISGTTGCYQVVYTTSSGDVYEGTFTIN